MRICTFEGCGRQRKYKLWCTAHYLQLWRGKELAPLRTVNRKPPETCTVEGCDGPYRARGFCGGCYTKNHYAMNGRWNKGRFYPPKGSVLGE